MLYAAACFEPPRDEVASDEEAHFDGALRQAEQLCFTAYQMRYGSGLSRELYKRLDNAEEAVDHSE
jgi:hypothetical protein